MSKNKYAVISHSGGLDSSTLLLHLLEKGYDCTCLSFDYGQKHKIELERATDLVNYLNDNNIDDTKIKHQIIKLDGLSNLLNSTLVEGGNEVPEGHYVEENMKDTVVPNRNKIFSSIIQAVALSIANKNECEVEIALGIHAGDHSIYPDCRQEFRDADYHAFILGNWEGNKVNYYTPYLKMDKAKILADGIRCCRELGLNYKEIYKRTNTSYKPFKFISDIESIYAGQGKYEKVNKYKWYSDYKSASSVERIEAFIKLNLEDPVEYADETGPVVWETAKTHVEQVLQNH